MIDEAYFAPDDTSKNPEIATLKISDGIMAHSVPERVEKVTTQAQTPSILRDALEIDSVIVAERGIRGRLMVDFGMFFNSFLQKGRYIVPISIADARVQRYMATPIRLEDSMLPTPPITKAAEGRFIKVNISSNSFFDISPLSNASAALIAPTGYPQRKPRAIGQDAPVERPNINLIGFLKK